MEDIVTAGCILALNKCSMKKERECKKQKVKKETEVWVTLKGYCSDVGEDRMFKSLDGAGTSGLHSCKD